MSLQDDVTAVAVLKALRDTVDAEYQAARRRVLDRLRTVPTARKPTRVTLPEGTLGATITMVYPAPAAVVIDDEALTSRTAGDDRSGVRTRVRACASWQPDLTSIALRSDGTEEIGRAWHRGEIDLRELLCFADGRS
jgi:hypothetical protein